MDEVFKALADPSRRLLVGSLNARNGQSLRQLCAQNVDGATVGQQVPGRAAGGQPDRWINQ